MRNAGNLKPRRKKEEKRKSEVLFLFYHSFILLFVVRSDYFFRPLTIPYIMYSATRKFGKASYTLGFLRKTVSPSLASSLSHVRFQSDVATESAGKCPITGTSSAKATEYPQLKNVPAYPFVGSIIPQLSGVSTKLMSDPYAFWLDMRKDFGDFYSLGIPGTGSAKDSKGIMYLVSDPKEMAKVVRSGGSYPSGMAQGLWLNNKWTNMRGLKTGALFQQGEEWKRIRTFMQTDLLHPEAAKGYVAGMVQAAQIASKGAPYCKDNLNQFFNRCAFDLFASIMFGELTKSADPNSKTDPENHEFAQNVVDGLSNAIYCLMDPYESILGNGLGITTKRQQYSFDKFDSAWEIGKRKVEEFTDRKERGELNEYEKNSYLFKAIDRQKEEGSGVTLQEAQELAFTGLFAAVDTTSAILGWNIFNVARHEEVQQKLYDELSHAVATIGNGELTSDVLDRRNSPYLHACIRETQRLTPPSTLFIFKKVDNPLEVNGVPLEEGDVVGLEGYSIGMDEQFVDNPKEFRPERWLADAVAERKGTEKQVIDHAFLKEPFSQGARRCPGSRVAANETQVLLAQLVLDWKMDCPVKSLDDIKYSQKTLLELEVPQIEFEARAKFGEQVAA